MKKSKLIVNSFLLALLICLTFFNLALLLHAEGLECEEVGARECEDDTEIYCETFCYLQQQGASCVDYYFDSGECGCSGMCTQWWYFECSNQYFDYYECVTYGHECPMK